MRHRGEPESDFSTRYPPLTLRSVSSGSGQGTTRERMIKIRGEADIVEPFLADMRAGPAVLEAEPLSPVTNARAYVSLVVDSDS